MRNGVKWALGLVILVSLGLWWARRDIVPNPIRFAAGRDQSNDLRLARALAQVLTERGNPARVVEAKGSKDSLDRLQLDDAELAIIKGGATEMAGTEVISPLYPDVLLLIVRKGLKVQHISELKGRNASRVGKSQDVTQRCPSSRGSVRSEDLG